MPKKGQMVLKGKLTGRQKAQRKYNSKPEQRQRRAGRNQARAMLEKQGKVKKGDGKDIDHIDHNTGNNSPTNLQVQSKHVNRRDGGPGARMVNSLVNPPRKRGRKKK
jgi:hypothetical protein